ncbi:unnamed protein product, partial [Iphiclides podalirius]
MSPPNKLGEHISSHNSYSEAVQRIVMNRCNNDRSAASARYLERWSPIKRSSSARGAIKTQVSRQCNTTLMESGMRSLARARFSDE